MAICLKKILNFQNFCLICINFFFQLTLNLANHIIQITYLKRKEKKKNNLLVLKVSNININKF